MNAIVEISGKQFKVEKDSKLFVHRVLGKEGDKITFDNVLMLDNGSKITLGNPVVTGASVQAKILKHLKDDKVIVFKKKRRKGYKVKNGHRQLLTQIVVEKINEKGSKAQSKTQSDQLKDPKNDTKSVTKSAAKKPAVKKPAVKKPAVKKPAAKKPAAKKPAVKKPTTK